MGLFIWGAVAGIWIVFLTIGAGFAWLRWLGKPPHVPVAEELRRDGMIRNPAHYVFSVFSRAEEADNAIAAIRGSTARVDDVIRLTGEAGAARLDATGEDHGLFGRLVRLVEATVMDEDHVVRYEQEAREGHCVVGIRVHDADSRHTVESLLREHGAYFMNYYGWLQFERLPNTVQAS